MIEKWRPIAGYVGSYEVSNRGQVRSVPRTALGGGDGGIGVRNLRGRLLRPKLTNRGYLQVLLSVRGVHKMVLVHRLVATAFSPNPAGLAVVNHIDRCQTNNAAENLEWCTQRHNLQHARTHCATPTGDHRVSNS